MTEPCVLIVGQRSFERQWQETAGERQTGVVSTTANSVVPCVGRGRGRLKVEISGPARAHSPHGEVGMPSDIFGLD
jgi:hypothetical protein